MQELEKVESYWLPAAPLLAVAGTTMSAHKCNLHAAGSWTGRAVLELEALKVSDFPCSLRVVSSTGFSFIEAKEAHLGEESVQACISLSTLSHEAGQSNR